MLRKSFLWFLLNTFFPRPFPAPQALKIWPRPSGPRYCVCCTGCRTLGRVQGGTCRPAGAVPPQAPSARRRRKIFRGGAGVGRFGGQRGGQGQNITFLGLPGTPRSRQDASIECYAGGSIRPSSGCNGVHVLCLKPLIWRSLCMLLPCAPSSESEIPP